MQRKLIPLFLAFSRDSIRQNSRFYSEIRCNFGPKFIAPSHKSRPRGRLATELIPFSQDQINSLCVQKQKAEYIREKWSFLLRTCLSLSGCNLRLQSTLPTKLQLRQELGGKSSLQQASVILLQNCVVYGSIRLKVASFQSTIILSIPKIGNFWAIFGNIWLFLRCSVE